MIISASRRTDIPAFYSNWFVNRIKAGYVCVRNPMNYHQVSEISLDPKVVDCIVFWTKNPAPMLPHREHLKDYHYYFQFTLNPYGRDLEPGLPPKDQVIETFRQLSRLVGPERVIWRYDPIIIIKNTIDEDYHYRQFACLAESLAGYTRKCIISFVDFYRKVQRKLQQMEAVSLTAERKIAIAQNLAAIADRHHLTLETCAEDIAIAGISPAACIDKNLIEAITGTELKEKKDPNQRSACGCIESIDIGAYDSCRHGCKYCYANLSGKTIKNNIAAYDVNSPLLCSSFSEEKGDKKTIRKVESCSVQNPGPRLFDHK